MSCPVPTKPGQVRLKREQRYRIVWDKCRDAEKYKEVSRAIWGDTYCYSSSRSPTAYVVPVNHAALDYFLEDRL